MSDPTDAPDSPDTSGTSGITPEVPVTPEAAANIIGLPDPVEAAKITKAPRSLWLKFILPSALGAFLFLAPVPNGESFTIPFGILVDLVNNNLGLLVNIILISVTVISAVGTIAVSVFRLGPREGAIARTFRTGPLWVILRVLGAVFCVMFFLGVGPDFIIGEATGGTVVGFLMKNLVVLFFFASLALPLLTDYGFMEFVGVGISGFFRKVFRLPGRAGIDGLASWLGAAPIAVMLTLQQFSNGVYTKREAASVTVTFSIVSLPFCFIICRVVGLEAYFFQFYGSIMFIGLVCALILPRIPPLTWIPDTYAPGVDPDQAAELVQPGETKMQAATRLALARAKVAPGFKGFMKAGFNNLVGIWIELLPATMAIAMIALMIVEHTPIFNWLSMPLIPVLDWAGVAEASAAAPAFIIGFADMYLPALVGAEIANEQTRFLIGILSISQLVYMSEVGALILRSNMGLKFGHLVMIFIIRTLIAAPIAILIARLLFG